MLAEHVHVATAVRPRREALLPPAIILLVFAMVVVAVAGFAYVSGQQQSLGQLRTQSDRLRDAASLVQMVDADATHVLNGEPGAMANYFRDLELLKGGRDALDSLPEVTVALDKLMHDWGDAVGLSADGKVDQARALFGARGTAESVDRISTGAADALRRADIGIAEHDDRIRLGTLAVLVLQVLSGVAAMSGMFFAFRSSAREAVGRSAALRSADTSREQVARLFEMADVLQSATDYGDANQVLKATATDLLPGFSGALYVFNNSRDRLVLSTSWGRPDDVRAPETIQPDQCWALKRGKPHLNRLSGSKLCCEHHHGDDTVLEIPMIARGEIMGLFQLFTTSENAEARLDAVTGLAAAIADGMSLALANMGLREKLKNQALRDPLTGLYNRRYMEDCLQRFVRLADRENREISVVMVDLDHFKKLNDTHGHAFGDSVLRDTAMSIVSGLRETDVVCRYGGEELVVILPDCNLDRAADKAEALRVRVAALTQSHGTDITASFGVASVPYTSNGVSDLLAAADGALYRAKQAGRNRVVVAPTRPFALERLEDALDVVEPLRAAAE